MHCNINETLTKTRLLIFSRSKVSQIRPTMKLKFRALMVFVIYCVSVGHTKKRKRVENDVIEKAEVLVKFPVNTFEVPVQTRKRDSRNITRRVVYNVQPVEENCRSQGFLQELKQLKKNVKCIPRDTAVELIAQAGTTIIPNTVIVKRCGGACNGYKQCIPVERRNVTFYVKTKKSNQIYCSSIVIPEDVKCKCGCERKPNCLSSQTYSSDLCKCICKQRKMCQTNFVWDEASCSCVCNRGCTTGTVLNYNECRCVVESGT